jgi:hypothetical protein
MPDASYPFLSDRWISAARKVRDEFMVAAGEPPRLRMNVVVNGVPFGDGDLDAHLDTTEGHVSLELGHLDAPDVTVSTDYETAKTIFVEQDPNAAMQSFFAGKVRVQGDLAKLLAFQAMTSGNEETGRAISERLRAITAS